LVVARACKKVHLTDRSPEAISLVEENIQANGLDGFACASCFSFGEDVSKLGNKPQFDFILCSDVVYDIRAVPLLVQSLHALLTDESTAYISFKKRNKQRETILLRALSENFDVTSEAYAVPSCLGDISAQFVILRVRKEKQTESILLLTDFEENDPSTRAVEETRGEAEVIIREFKSTDQEVVLSIFRKGLFQYAVEGSIVTKIEEAYYKVSSESDMKDIESYYVNTPGRGFWVAYWKGQIVGIVGAVTCKDGGVELQRMSVLKERRGKGVGGKLVHTVLDFARSQKAPKVKLGTLDRKVAAIGLYKKHGFKQVSTVRITAESIEHDYGVCTEEAVDILGFELLL
jgi:putative acetyltransferase